jgi:DNA-binding NarL/FixJ family response regulator
VSTGFLFRASWPIVDEDYTRTQLIVEASAHVDSIAMKAGARILGDITWTIRGGRLIAQSDAEPLRQVEQRAPHGSISRQLETILVYRDRGLTDPEIALRLGCSADAVKKTRHRARARAA